MAAKKFYEDSLFHSLQQAHRVTKPSGVLVLVYAHKTTLGWSTLVDAIRRADYEVTEAWPMDTETKARVAHQGDAALASSIFLVARKRQGTAIGKYEEVRPELERIVQERVSALWDMGISGPDLLIASVGAGLRAFTRYASVEYANGDQVPAERFLAEVETVVLDAMMTKLSAEVGSDGRYSLVGVDPASRFYVLWRYTYRAEELEAGEAIIFANGTHVELDGPHALSSGSNPLLQKKTSKNKSRYRLLDYTERGDDAKLGMSSADGQPASLVDVLHRLLWLMERHPSSVGDFLKKANPNTDQLRIVAQALARPALKGSTVSEIASGAELASLTKLTANWRSVVDEEGPLFKASSQRT
jgi:putative DNA methylase